jgi:phosphoadenosine phosphosulfate reductase
MSLIENTLFGKTNKVDVAINRIKEFDPIKNGIMDEPYYVAYSGGKDSDAIRILFELAGVKYDLVHNHTTADAPETVYYIRSIKNIIINYPEISMWQLIEKKKDASNTQSKVLL